MYVCFILPKTQILHTFLSSVSSPISLCLATFSFSPSINFSFGLPFLPLRLWIPFLHSLIEFHLQNKAL